MKNGISMKRCISMLVALIMVLGMLPGNLVTAHAEETDQMQAEMQHLEEHAEQDCQETVPQVTEPAGTEAAEEDAALTGTVKLLAAGGTLRSAVSGSWTYELDEVGHATITKYNGNATSVTVPDTLDGNLVVAIGYNAFYENKELKNIVIPDSVLTIGGSAFSRCPQLKSVVLSKNLTSIDSNAFYDCDALTSIVIPDSVIRIGSYAFSDCTNLASVTLSKSLEELGACAFGSCTALKSIEIPKSLKSGGYSYSWDHGAFNGCSALKTVTFEAEATEIATYLFAGCTGIEEIVIPDTVTKIGYHAFEGAVNLRKVTIGEAVTLIESYAFQNCTSLEAVVIPDFVTEIGNSAFADCTKLAAVTMPKNLQVLNGYAFQNCTALTAIEIPKSLTKGYYPFAGCSGLKTVTFEAGTTEIAEYLFYNCNGIEEIVIPDTVTVIEPYAFYNAVKLRKVTVGNAVETIGNSAFYSCKSLEEIVLPDSVTVMGYEVFKDCGELVKVTLSDSLTVIPSSAFEGCVKLTTVDFPEHLLSIGMRAFRNCDKLADVAIPDTVTDIYSDAFYDCQGLTSIVIPDSVIRIGSYAFSDCTNLASVTLSKSLEELGASAFRSCTALKSIEIPKSLKSGGSSYSSGYGAFNGCSALKTVTFEAETTEIATYLFAGCTGIEEIVIPDTVTKIGYRAFEGAENLRKVTIGEAVTLIESYAFQNCTSLEAVVIPDFVTEIGNSAFAGCTKLAAVTLPKNLQVLNYNAFQNCTALTAIEIPKSLTKGYYPFAGCSGLKTVTFEAGTTEIAEYLFYNCNGIEEIVIPDTVTVIETYAFYNAVKLRKVTVGNAVETIGNYAFESCKSLEEIVLPDSVTVMGYEVFKDCGELVKVTLSDSLTVIPYSAFSGCVKLATMNLPVNLEEIGYGAFRNCDGLTGVDMPDTVTKIGYGAFYDCDGMTEIHLSEALSDIPYDTFYDCDALAAITIPASVTSIGNSAFYDCDALVTVEMTDSVTKLGTQVFYHNDSLKNVRLSHYLTVIPSGAFRECPLLEVIVIPYYVTTIEANAFNSSSKLTTVVTYANLTSINSTAFSYQETTVFYGAAGSYAEAWAVQQGYPFVENTTAATSLVLSDTALSIPKGVSHILRVTIDPTDFGGVIQFKSSNPNVLTVDANGKLTAVGVGTANIKVEAGGLSAVCKVTVTQAVTSISLNRSSLSLKLPETYQLTATVYPADASNPRVIWTSSNEAAATVDENGLVTAIGNGTSVITATAADGTGVSRSCTVTVVDPNNVPVSSISLNTTKRDMEAMDTYQLKATIWPTNAANQNVTWTSSDSNIAIVDENGLITAVAKGTATITATASDGYGASQTCTVTVLNSGFVVESLENFQSPHPYENNCDDFWFYTVPYTDLLKITFAEETELEDGFDYLHIYDGNGNLIGDYTGTELSGITIEIPGGTVKVRMDSDDSTNAWGFQVVEIEAVPHTHKFTNYISDNNATCTEDGTKTAACDGCEVTDTVVDEGSVLGHDLGEWETVTEATCTEDGSMCRVCSRCEYSETNVISAPGHKYESVTTDPTCTESGNTTHTCTVCGYNYVDSYVDALGHTGGEATCSGQAVCTRCWMSYGELDANNHVGGTQLRDEKTVTCTETGYTGDMYCLGCNAKLTEGEVIDALGHIGGEATCNAQAVCTRCWMTYGELNANNHVGGIEIRNAKDATCTEDGYTGDTHCLGCSAKLTEGEVIEALNHDMGEWIITSEATCTEAGFKRSDCSRCDYFETESIGAVGHKHEAVVTAPTCTEKGYTTHICHCGDSYVDTYVEALDHKWDAGVITREPTEDITGTKLFTCERCGETMEETLPKLDHVHAYASAVTDPTCTEKGYTTHTCSCGDSYVDTYVDALDHTGGEATCCQKAICTRCWMSYGELDADNHIGGTEIRNAKEATCTEDGYTGDTHCLGCSAKLAEGEVITAPGHVMGDWSTVTSTTCTANGVERRACQNCDYYETREIDQLPHSYNAVVINPTCTEQGYTTNTCSCGDSYVDTYVDALGHDMGEWIITNEATCTEAGFKRSDCSRCDYFETESIGAVGHKHEAVVTAPTCTEKGYTTHICHCGDSYVDTYVDALDHNWDAGVITKEPTEEATGTKLFTCERCGETKEETLPKLDHVHAHVSVVTEPTCTEKGYTTHTCECGDSYVDAYVDALDHKWDAGVITKEPTEDTTGTKLFACERCEETREETLPKLDHVHAYTSVVTEPSCTERGYTTHTCSCGDSYVDSYVDALGHEWGVWAEVSESNYKRECAVCGESQTMTLDEDKPVNTTDKEDNAANADLKNDSIELIEKVLTEEEQTKAAEGTEVKVYLKTEDISDNVSTEISAEVKTKAGDSEIGMYLDINLFKQIGSAEEIPVRETSSAVTVTITVPEYLINTDGTVTRTYKIIRVHADENGGLTTSVLAGIFNSEDNSLSFETDKFSTYALVYEDVQAEEPLPEANIQVARMILGNELAMQFAFPKDKIVEGVEYVVSVTKSYADGRADKNILVPMDQWGTSGNYYYVSFNGIAAKEMGDTINAQILTADGVAVGDVYVDSIREYALRQLRKTTDAKTRTLYVDMLNYGAAAQTYFKYDAENLVTDELTPEEKAYGTKEVKLENNLVKGPGYGASQLNLASSIQLRVKFNGIDSSMYAIVKFTNHMGREIEARVEGSEFMYSGTVVVIDDVVAADYDRDVTITVYNASGNAVASAVESVASYIARMSGGAEIYSAVAKYCAAAYGYLHRND